MRKRLMAGRAIALTLTLLSAGRVEGQVPASSLPPPIKTMTFEAAVQQAIERNPSLARAATSIMRAESILQQTRAFSRPMIDARVANSTLDTETAFEGGVIQPQNQTTFGASFSMPVLAPARWAQTAQARDQIEVATRTTAEVRQQIAVATAQAYLAVLTAQRQVGVELRSLETAQAHLEYASKRLEAGAGSRLNMVRAAQETTTEAGRLETVRLALLRAQEALGVLVVESGPVDASADPVLSAPTTVDETAWMRARLDVLAQDSIIRAAQRVVTDSRKDWWPEALASFDPQVVTPSGVFSPSRTWRLTVGLSQPLFDSGLRAGRKAERQVALDAEKLALTEIEVRARSEVRLAQAAVDSLARVLATAREGASQAEEVLKITVTSFELGATTNLEVIDAQRSARDLETAAALAEDALQRARLDLLVATGQFPK